MSVIDSIGQLCMVGFEGTEVTPDLRAWLQEYRPGGIILFKRNLVDPLQVAALTEELQALAGDTPFLIAIDQEGGRVSRLPPGFTIFPPAATVAQSGSSWNVHEPSSKQQAPGCGQGFGTHSVSLPW